MDEKDKVIESLEQELQRIQSPNKNKNTTATPTTSDDNDNNSQLSDRIVGNLKPQQPLYDVCFCYSSTGTDAANVIRDSLEQVNPTMRCSMLECPSNDEEWSRGLIETQVAK